MKIACSENGASIIEEQGSLVVRVPSGRLIYYFAQEQNKFSLATVQHRSWGLIRLGRYSGSFLSDGSRLQYHSLCGGVLRRCYGVGGESGEDHWQLP